MNKQRQLVYNKFNGHCAYCGCILEKKWHVDHLLPIERNRVYDKINRKWKYDGTCNYPERNNIDNLMPACPSCNINKYSMSLESFRNLIQGFLKHLNNVSTQYKIAKRYHLIKEIQNKVAFYFEDYK